MPIKHLKNLSPAGRACLGLAALLLCTLLAWAPTALAQEKTDGAQEFGLTILDSMDRPVAGAQVKITAKAGSPAGKPPFVSDARGRIKLAWTPKVTEQAKDRQSGDKLLSYLSQFDYVIEKQGFLPYRGHLSAQTRSRSMAAPELASLNLKAKFLPAKQVVVLTRQKDLFGPGLAKRPHDDPLRKACLELRQRMQPVLPYLGLSQALPGFDFAKGRLTINLNFTGPRWGALSNAPLKARMTVSSALPLAVALGQDWGGLPGVKQITIRLMSEQRPKHDLHAMPRKMALVLRAPSGEFAALGAGKMKPVAFLRAHPPGLRRLEGGS